MDRGAGDLRARGDYNARPMCIRCRRMELNSLYSSASPASRSGFSMPIFFSPRGSTRLWLLLAALLTCGLVPAQARAQDHAHHTASAPAAKRVRHPAPRPGITAEGVLPADSVTERARDVYTMAARIPSLLDGLYCHCDCHERDELRSLLECFHSEMASTCGICSGQARLAFEMHQEGRTLRDIRKAVDRTYAP